jgi:hypothetical protein
MLDVSDLVTAYRMTEAPNDVSLREVSIRTATAA